MKDGTLSIMPENSLHRSLCVDKARRLCAATLPTHQRRVPHGPIWSGRTETTSVSRGLEYQKYVALRARARSPLVLDNARGMAR